MNSHATHQQISTKEKTDKSQGICEMAASCPSAKEIHDRRHRLQQRATKQDRFGQPGDWGEIKQPGNATHQQISTKEKPSKSQDIWETTTSCQSAEEIHDRGHRRWERAAKQAVIGQPGDWGEIRQPGDRGENNNGDGF